MVGPLASALSFDIELFRQINIAWGYDALAPFMRFMSNQEYFFPAILALVIWMVWKDGVRGRVTVLTLVLLIAASDQLVSSVLKPAFNRPRPCRAESGLEGVKNHGARCSSRGSFPSAHAANIAAACLLLALRYRRAWIPGVFMVFFVGYSRVFLGVHYPLDVLGGWGLGAALGLLAAAAARGGETVWHRRRERPPTT